MSNPIDPNSSTIRLRNCLALYQDFIEMQVQSGSPPSGLERLFAQSIEISPSLWSQVKSGGRSIGEKLARQIESKSKKPARWLDVEHEDTLADPAEAKFLELCKSVWQKSNSAEKSELKRLIKAAAAGLESKVVTRSD
jgi:hypothetical protein